MTRFPAYALIALSLAACRVEQTPAEYIDNTEIGEDDVSAVVSEIRDRVRSTGPALERRSLNDLQAALAPMPDLFGWGVGANAELSDGDALLLGLSEIAAGQRVEVDEPTVQAGPRNNTAWFRTAYHVTNAAGETLEIRFSGVFVHHGGEWRLVEAHLSEPPTELPSNPAEAEADTPGGA